MNIRFKLCTFDVTNTLLKFKIPVGDQYTKVGLMYGVKRDPNQMTESFLHNWKIMNLKHPNFGQTTGVSSREWWKEVVRRTFTLNSSELTNKQLDSISHHLYDLYKSNVCWTVAPGAESLLKHLRQKRVVLGVISNFDERLDCVLKSNGLNMYFDFILASYVAQVAKPSRKIFELALDQVPQVVASEALHVGDDFKLDYLGAKEAGWSALLLGCKSLNEEVLKEVNPREIVTEVGQIEQFVLNS